VASVNKPVNVVMTPRRSTVPPLRNCRRRASESISVGGSFARSARSSTAREMKEHGAFTFVHDAAPGRAQGSIARGVAAMEPS
jgi:hypothetical protein